MEYRKDTHTVEEIDKFLSDVAICNEGVQMVKEKGIYGLCVDDAIKKLRELGLTSEAAQLKLAKKTETYLKYNGTEIIMGAYHVFNPLTGTHIECQTADEARNTLSRLYKELIDLHKPSVCQSISNENGDSTWVPVELVKDIQINIL